MKIMIEVTASKELEQMKLNSLIGWRGYIVEANLANTGSYVKFDKKFEGFDEWFIPNSSIKQIELWQHSN